jgi:ABC-type phosphate transport system substrate-binding protein
MRALNLAILVSAITLAVTDEPAHGDQARKPVAIAVIVAKSSKITGMSANDLKRAFTGETVSAGGGRLVPFNQNPSSGPRAAFDRVVLRMTADEVGRFWVDRKIRGETGAPRALASSAQTVKVVAKFPNAIGYVPVDEVTADVKVIAVDGDLPGDDNYTLWTP